ncbi:hypothetical protein HDV00_001663 [Rhizophlyctis rosea]|nr:hypothetical protein HDV00_001663 [Rhizophlyctis rosea]
MSPTIPGGKKIVIIGAGVGGVALASRLSKEGHNVTVVEKNDFVGGRCSLIHHEGYRFDQGPSLWLMPRVFEEAFTDIGENVYDHVKLVKCDPNYIVHFHDGDRIQLSTDLMKLKDEVERIEPGSFEGLLGFIQEGRVHYDLSVAAVLSRNFEKFTDLINLKNAHMALQLDVLSTCWRRISRYFKSDKLRQAFTFQTMYMGMSPYDAPGTYNLLQYTELAEGVWYPIGGFNIFIQKLEAIAKNFGTKFLYSSPVKSIDIDPSTNLTTGITLENDTHIPADIVVCNADLVTAYNTLLPATPYAKSLGKQPHTSSTFSFYWGMDRIVEGLEPHNVFLAGQDYRSSFDDIFKHGTLPSEPSFYLHVPSRVDPTAAPPNKDSITILVPVASMNHKADAERDFDKLRARARKAVIAAIEKHLNITDFEKMIVVEDVNGPPQWEKKFGLWGGSALGLSHNVMQVTYFRPSTRHAKYGNLFFVGASTHPGTGVPIVLKGAKIVADQIQHCIKRGSFSSQLIPLELISVLFALFVAAGAAFFMRQQVVV